MRTRLKFVFIFSFLLLIGSGLKAQPGFPPGPPPGPPGDGNPFDPVPISGIEILLGVGALLGAKRFLSSKKEKS